MLFLNKLIAKLRSTRLALKRRVRGAFGERSSAARLARGVAAGCFAAAFPLPGLQIPLSLLVAWAVRGSKAVAILPQFISNAGTMVPLAFLQFKIGAGLWPGQAAEIDQAIEALSAVVSKWEWRALGESLRNLFPALGGLGLEILGPMVLGVLITGMTAAMASYPVTLMAVATWRARQRSRRLRRAGRPSAPPPLILPQTVEPPLTRAERLARYARHPNQFQCASAVKLLVDGGEAYPEMLAAIDSATSTVDLETYILQADLTGTRFQEALARAARRGVHVRLLYDYVGSLGRPDRFVRDLRDAGVEVAIYRPPILSRPLWAMHRRDHRKMLVVDRRVLFLGGLNIADEYTAVEEGGRGWRDTHIRLDGQEVAEAAERLFDLGWRDATAYGTRARLAVKVRKRLRRLVPPRRAGRRGTDAFSALLDTGIVPVQIIGNEEFRFRRRIHRAYLYAIKRARQYILIENAYFIPDRAVRRALARAVKRGVLVAVAVARHSDVAIAAHASRNLYSELLRSGVRIFEWPQGMLHAKTAAIDDAWAIVGSYNFDHRSLFHQLEAVAVVADPDFVRRLREQTLADLARCHELTLWEHESRSWCQMLLESGAYLLRPWL